MVAAIRYLGGDLMREGITCSLGPDPCINHALIGIAGARFGNGRLILPAGWPCTPVYRISGPGLDYRWNFTMCQFPPGSAWCILHPMTLCSSLKLIMVNLQIHISQLLMALLRRIPGPIYPSGELHASRRGVIG